MPPMAAEPEAFDDFSKSNEIGNDNNNSTATTYFGTGQQQPTLTNNNNTNANAKLELCCKRQQLPSTCQQFCNFDTFTQEKVCGQ